ncbi:hypothetical protein TcCL_ESM11194 [Trypanosoma cruzi]|uniref:Uncharacterized protein n=1 Tax=Trypanosoma cruzi (strain CL Brener) TaxID=353153 RepID=Q4CUF5_TRYCC|nr:hypothetical protein Tc00.1047053503859.50 [Trypanosoma cruzi]EAN83908.1 hypothetical protein Tc00.1047053503859.50 [Trypanosoma cruzi]RNC51661.1 hypothetical protein TcCL_ESM11194 [Trypanosoma cruzi]|eukprot:XP_805759.1 hypothetical protein [Trypanosoma cruzi strain CL Brener]
MRPTPQPIAGASGMTAAPPPAAGAVGLGTRTQLNKFSQMVLAALSASRRFHRRAQKTTGQGRHRRSVRTPVVFRHHLQPNNRHNLQQHQSPTMTREQRPPPTATAAPRSSTPPPIFCVLLSRMRAAAVVPGQHVVVCAEYERRPKATELFL